MYSVVTSASQPNLLLFVDANRVHVLLTQLAREQALLELTHLAVFAAKLRHDAPVASKRGGAHPRIHSPHGCSRNACGHGRETAGLLVKGESNYVQGPSGSPSPVHEFHARNLRGPVLLRPDEGLIIELAPTKI